MSPHVNIQVQQSPSFIYQNSTYYIEALETTREPGSYQANRLEIHSPVSIKENLYVKKLLDVNG